MYEVSTISISSLFKKVSDGFSGFLGFLRTPALGGSCRLRKSKYFQGFDECHRIIKKLAPSGGVLRFTRILWILSIPMIPNLPRVEDSEDSEDLQDFDYFVDFGDSDDFH